MNLSQRTSVFATAALVVAALAAFAVPAPAAAAVTRYTVDGAHTNVGFSIRHFVTKVNGRFNEFEGAIAYDPANPAASSVELTVQAKSIDTNNSHRDDDLRSENFFDVAKFPTLTFKSTSVKAAGKGLEVTGDLTIHGVTKKITIPVELLGSMGKKTGFATSFTLDRTDYGVVWNRALEGGGTILGDDVAIDISIEANVEEPEAPKS